MARSRHIHPWAAPMTDTRHDADEVVGRITIRRTWDRRYKIVHPAPDP